MNVSMATGWWKETESDAVLLANYLGKSLSVDFQKVGNRECEPVCFSSLVSYPILDIFKFGVNLCMIIHEMILTRFFKAGQARSSKSAPKLNFIN